jgi:hypothetical protein
MAAVSARAHPDDRSLILSGREVTAFLSKYPGDGKLKINPE